MQLFPRSLRLLGVAEPDLDDLSQDVLLAAYESLDHGDELHPPLASWALDLTAGSRAQTAS
ncbi:hypothetical protein WME94_32340 [Sorangium sp. So ce429]